jgi:hypothetical protein
LSEQPAPAAPAHPWEGIRFTTPWSVSRPPLNVVLVEQVLVAEIVVDTALERGVWRHPVRFAWVYLDVTVDDVPSFGTGMRSAAG